MIMDACFFCTTPFQVLSALSLVISLQEKADLYIIKQFEKADIYGERIRELGIFDEVCVIHEDEVYEHEDSPNQLITHLRIAKSYLHVSRIASKILLPNKCYERMYISSRAYLPRMVQLYFCKKKINTEVIYYDDGEGSYINPQIYKPRFFDAVLRFVLFGAKSMREASLKYLYSPELYALLNAKKDSQEIRKIIGLWENLETKKMINHVFDYNETKHISEKVIILDSLYSGEERKKVNQLYQSFVDSYGAQNVIIKKHPRDTSASVLPCKQYDDFSTPFEVLCLNMDMNEKVLVCSASTALIMPKLLLDKEPEIFMFYKLLDSNTTINDMRDNLYRECAKTYRTKNKYHVIENIDQLKLLLENKES